MSNAEIVSVTRRLRIIESEIANPVSQFDMVPHIRQVLFKLDELLKDVDVLGKSSVISKLKRKIVKLQTGQQDELKFYNGNLSLGSLGSSGNRTVRSGESSNVSSWPNLNRRTSRSRSRSRSSRSRSRSSRSRTRRSRNRS